jgi:hypothetical protein
MGVGNLKSNAFHKILIGVTCVEVNLFSANVAACHDLEFNLLSLSSKEDQSVICWIQKIFIARSKFKYKFLVANFFVFVVERCPGELLID